MKLSEFKLITSAQYMELDNPIFIGQTRLNENNDYYMCWECNGVKYKTKQNLFS